MLIEWLLIAFVVLIGSIFLAGGVLLITGVGSHLWERWGAFFAALESRNWVATTGKITRSVVTYTSSSRRGRTYAPAIRYTYGAGGESFVSERFAFVVTEGGGDLGLAEARAAVERFRAGSNVEVFYDPEKPKRATLDRSVPPVLGLTVGWLLTLLVGSGIALFLGVIIVLGPFEDPPNLGDVPPLSAQFGGLAAAIGVLLLLVAGVRAIGGEERRQRRLLTYLKSAKPALAHDVRAGELVTVCGRAEELDWESSEDEDASGTPDEDMAAESEGEIEHPGVVELPFEDAPLIYYDVDVEWFRRTCFTFFGVRDASGVVMVELRATESTLLQNRRLRIEGEVERWLDEQRDDKDDPISAHPEWLRFERIQKGDLVLIVGRAEREDDGLVFRASAGDPTTLLVAAGSREEIVERFGKRIGRTRALLYLGAALIVLGVAAMVRA